jgi:ComEC/Rec2-related protein
VAISGLNMALSAGIFFVGLRHALGLLPGFAQAYPTKKIAAAAALLALTAYYMISGFAVSAERAFIMMAIMLIAALFDRPSISLRNIALSALLIIVTSPSEALGPSFQMSFAATLALVAGFAIWTKRPHRDSVILSHPAIKPVVFVLRFFGGIAMTSMIGGFSTALFSIEHFHRLSAYGLPANLMAMPVISFIVMPAGMLAMLFTPLGLDVWPWKVAGLGLDIVIDIAKTVSGWGGTVDIGRIPEWYFATAVLGFLVAALLPRAFAISVLPSPRSRRLRLFYFRAIRRPTLSCPTMAAWSRRSRAMCLPSIATDHLISSSASGNGRWRWRSTDRPIRFKEQLWRSQKKRRGAPKVDAAAATRNARSDAQRSRLCVR